MDANKANNKLSHEIGEHDVLIFELEESGAKVRVELKEFKAWLAENNFHGTTPDLMRKYIELKIGYRAPQKPVSSYERHAFSKVVLPPGHRLSVIAAFLLTRDAYKRYVAPVIADMQQEYIDALAAGHVWHARWIAVRGHLLVIPGWLYAFVAGKLAALTRRGR